METVGGGPSVFRKEGENVTSAMRAPVNGTKTGLTGVTIKK